MTPLDLTGRLGLLALLLAATACADPERPAPGADAGRAPECQTRQDCEAKGEGWRGMVCGSSGFCEGCASDGQCGLRERCDEATRRCGFKPGWGDDCARNGDCQAGELCVQGLCRPEREATLCVGGVCLADGQRCNRTNGVCEEDIGCLDDFDCGELELCNVPTHTCVLRCSPKTEAEVCAAGQKCVDSRCSQCADNGDCPGGLVCDRDRLRCAVDGSERCTSDRDCPVGLTCNRGVGFCTEKPPPCLSNDDCLPDERCEVASGKCLVRACQPDRFEPNEAADEATPLPAGFYPGLTLCDHEQDWFALALSRGDRIRALLDAEVLFEDRLELRLLEADGRVLAAGKLQLERTVAADATYYLRVQSTDAFVPYGLRLIQTREVPCDDDRFEPNDAFAHATALHGPGTWGLLTLCGADVDWFSAPLPPEGGTRVAVDVQPGGGGADLALFAGDGETELARGQSQGLREVAQVEPGSVPQGTILVRVAASDSRAPVEYQLTVEPVP